MTFNSFRRFSSSRNKTKQNRIVWISISETFSRRLPASRIQRSRFSFKYSIHGRRTTVSRAIGVVIDDGFLSGLITRNRMIYFFHVFLIFTHFRLVHRHVDWIQLMNVEMVEATVRKRYFFLDWMAMEVQNQEQIRIWVFSQAYHP